MPALVIWKDNTLRAAKFGKMFLCENASHVVWVTDVRRSFAFVILSSLETFSDT